MQLENGNFDKEIMKIKIQSAHEKLKIVALTIAN
jgi:hypothetical protein